MKLAKDYIDVGYQTNHLEPMMRFWQGEVGLPYEELLKVGGGTHQHRHSLRSSVFKLNSVRDPLPTDNPTGYRHLYIATPGLAEPRPLVDPDGNRVTLVPEGYRGITHIGIGMTVSSIDAFTRYYRDVLQIEQLDDRVFRWATTLFLLDEDPGLTPATDMRGTGFRYITVQVWKVDTEHQAYLDRGGVEGRPPVTLGTTARISFIKDPDDNWIEVSQRASLTGDLT